MTDLTPVDVERKLTQLVGQITNAQNNLRVARDAETEAAIALKKARLIAADHEDCPVPSRGSTTVAQRDDWIDAHVMPEWSAAKRAETSREIAQDALRATLAIAETVRSLGASVRTAYDLAGRAS